MARFSVPGFMGLLLAMALAQPVTAQAPEVFENGVVNGASFTPFGEPGHPVAPGSIISIFGTNFAYSFLEAMTVPLSTSLGGVSVTFDGIPAPLFFVLQDDPYGQIIAQLPSELVGPVATIEVSTDYGVSLPLDIQVNSFSPGIFTDPPGGVGEGVVVFTYEPGVFAALPSIWYPHDRPARPGDFLTIYANGLGPVDHPVPNGEATPSPPPLVRTVEHLVVTLGGVACPILFSGLAPGFVALNQINIQVPKGAPKGAAVPIQIAVGGVTSSDQVTIAVQ
ncbi:MAG: hypothetical protein HY236_03105 [Acidobacteria bacterium]|nr:hypothetical protein [Acidobacteriota bacterium]